VGEAGAPAGVRRALATAALGLAAWPAGANAVEALPDLVADPPVDRGLRVSQGERLLLRFDGFIRNAGSGAAELRGAAGQDGVLTDVRQRIYNEDGSVSREIPSSGLVRYEHHADHSHFHLQSAARYSLWTESGAFEVLDSEKAGFCLTDSAHSEPQKGPPTPWYSNRLGGNPEFSFCSSGNPTAQTPVVMGISSGWRDDYPYTLAFQWVDVSSLAPGRYRLGADVDPDNVLVEADERNLVVLGDPPSLVPGYLPRGRNLGEVNPLVPLRIELDAERYAPEDGPGLGPAAFRVRRAPRCGRLTGEAPRLVYVPARGCRGGIRLEFSVRDASSDFPTTAPTAGVRFRLGPRRALSPSRVTQRGRRLRVRMLSRYRGRLRATALIAAGRLGSCTVRALERRRVGCTLRLPPGIAARGILLRTELLVGGRTVARRLDPR
jgi:hypothetical protein